MASQNKHPGHERGGVKQPACPYLIRFTAQQQQVAPVDYPSFENQCLAGTDEAALPLAEQATFCLSGSYRLCERYSVVQLTEPWSQPAAETFRPAVEPTAPGQPAAPWPVEVADWDPVPARPNWAWAGAAVIFVAVLIVGGAIAAYVGWQLVEQGQLLARTGPTGPISTLGAAQSAAQAPTFLIVTATNQPPPPAILTTPVAVAQESSPTTPSYPEAVTPTPIVVLATDSSQAQAQPIQQAVAPNAAPANVLLPTVIITAGATATPVAIINVLQEVPTRRPTPSFEIPTDTPVPVEPTATATLMILGTPVVIFGPDESSIPPGECTHVRWHVVNVREVYYDNLPALGDGAKEECISDEADSYALRVIFGDGSTQIFTATVSVLWPSPTPTLTPSFTPEPLATETWTPAPPTATPTPDVIWAVALRLNDSNPQRCTAGADCEIALLATNMGDSPDTLSVEFLQRGAANGWLCRQDGVCAEQKLTLSNVGPGNTAFIVLRVSLPADSAGTRFTYGLRAISDGSQGTMASEAVTVEIESQAP